MRNVAINLSNLNEQYECGQCGEFNATQLTVTVSSLITESVSFLVAVFKNGFAETYNSERYYVTDITNNVIEVPLWQSLTKTENEIMVIEAYGEDDGEINLLHKSDKIYLHFDSSIYSDDAIMDDSVNGLYKELLELETDLSAIKDQAVAATTSATNAASAANTAATAASTVAATVQAKLDNGDFIGAKGDKGDKGDTGADGFSPSASVTQTASGATVDVTDKTGTTSANLTNGTDGFSPIVSVERVTNGVRITILDKDGTHTAIVNDGSSGTMDYTQLENLPREPYTPEAQTVDFLGLADGIARDAMGDFTLARYNGQAVVTSIDVHAGDMFSVGEYNSTDGYSMIALFCNQGVFSFQSNLADWSKGYLPNAYDIDISLVVKPLPVEGVLEGGTIIYECDVTDLADGVYIAEQTTVLTGWVSGTLSISKTTEVKKVNDVLFVGNEIYTGYDLTTVVKQNVESGDIVQTTGQNTDKVVSQAAWTANIGLEVL